MCESISIILRKYNIQVTDDIVNRLNLFINFLIRKNSEINLISKADIDIINNDHVLDSLSFSLTNIKSGSLLDMGSGAGFPGLPIAIVFPDINVTLVESIKKKANFLKEAVDYLGLNNVNVISERLEIIGHDKKFRAQFDVVSARALANLNSLLEYSLPLLKKEGFFVAYKTENDLKDIESAKKALNILGGEFYKSKEYVIEGKDLKRNLIIFKKVANTPVKYPRSVGKPVKSPLI